MSQNFKACTVAGRLVKTSQDSVALLVSEDLRQAGCRLYTHVGSDLWTVARFSWGHQNETQGFLD